MANKLCTSSMSFTTWLTNSGIGRNKLTSLCIGKAIADNMQMSSSMVTDIESFYRTTLKLDIMRLVSTINELTLVDTEAVLNYVASFYTWRYRAAYSPRVIICSSQDTAIEDFFGINISIDAASLAEIRKDPATAMRVYNSAIVMIKEILAPDIQTPGV